MLGNIAHTSQDMPLRPHLHGFLFQYLSKGIMDTSLIRFYILSSVRQLHMATYAAGLNMTQHLTGVTASLFLEPNIHLLHVLLGCNSTIH